MWLLGHLKLLMWPALYFLMHSAGLGKGDGRGKTKEGEGEGESGLLFDFERKFLLVAGILFCNLCKDYCSPYLLLLVLSYNLECLY